MAWTNEETETCRGLYFEGRSSAIIAAQLGKTRNAVIGFIHRQAWNKAPEAPKRSPKLYGHGRPKSVSAIGKTSVRNPLGRKRKKMNVLLFVPKFEAIEMVELPPENAAIPFCDLQPNECRWMPSEPSYNAPCCGAKVLAGKSYCAYHFRRAYMTPKSREQREAETAAARRARAAYPDLQAKIA